MMRRPYAGREYPPRASRKCCEQIDEIGEGGIDFLFASESFGNAAHEQECAECDDKRHDAKTGDDQTVDKAAQRACEYADERGDRR